VLARFSHRAYYNWDERQIEMHLVSDRGQTVRLAALDFEFEMTGGETIRTEISRKFDVADLGEGLVRHGFELVETWTDPKDWFALTLARAVDL
jgi:uncharacterized SAM-dependent methyltransferase